MANADRPCGFRPYGNVIKAIVMEAGSACYPGDALTLASDGQVDPASAGGAICGIALQYASGAGEPVLVSVSPDQLYIAQADGSELSSQAAVGLTADIVATAGDSTVKLSRQEVDSSDATTGAAHQLIVMGLDARPDNAWGEFADVIVKINENQISEDFVGV